MLDLDEQQLIATLRHQYTHPGLLAASQGSVQVLPNGNVFVGWGSEPYVSEFSSSGRLLFDARLGNQYESYRAFRLPWIGRPAESPAVAVTRRAAQVRAYASWNGATEVAQWRLVAGPPGAMDVLGSAPARGFETVIEARTGETNFAVVALDHAGRTLGQSPRTNASAV